MQCAEFEDRLNRLLDHRLAPENDAQLAGHAQHCDDCASLLDAQHRLFASLRATRQAVPVDLAARVVARRHIELQSQRFQLKAIGWAAMLATAASVAWIAVMALKARDARNEFAGNRPPPALPTTKQQRRSGPSPLLAATTPGPRHVEIENLDETFVDYRRQFEEYTAELDEMSESLSPSIRPIQSSFGLAIDALRRTLPRGKETRSTKPEAGALFLNDLPVIG